jgi:hypothetical protein
VQDVHRANGMKRIDLVSRRTEIYRATKDVKSVRNPCPLSVEPGGRLSRPLTGHFRGAELQAAMDQHQWFGFISI